MHLVFIFRGNRKSLLKDKEKLTGQNGAYSFTYVSIWTADFDAVFGKILRLSKNTFFGLTESLHGRISQNKKTAAVYL
jgi:hypothetical protein